MVWHACLEPAEAMERCWVSRGDAWGGAGNRWAGQNRSGSGKTTARGGGALIQLTEEEEELWVSLVAKRKEARGFSINIKFLTILGFK